MLLWFSKIQSWKSQNASGSCSKIQRPAMAAGFAQLCVGSG
jgi:hypothetical protein